VYALHPMDATSALRIGIVCPYSLTIPGGVQAQVLGLARELRRRGHVARVLGPCDGPPPESFVTPLGDSLPLAANGSIAPIAPDLPAALRTLQILRDESFDVMHLHEPLVPGPTVTALVVHSAPTIGTFHAAGTSASYRFLKPALSRLINRIDCKVVVSKDALALAREHLGGEYEVLFNGVELEQIRGTRAYPTRPTDPPTVFFCGRHEHRKGLQVLIEALEMSDLDARVWIAGEGPETVELMERTSGDNRIEWLGRVTDEDKFARLRAADVFCAPSLGGESFGVVLIEAMAAGTAVVASSLDGYRNVATNGIDSILAPPGDVPALAEALEMALGDHQLATRLREAGERRAEQFAMSALADRYVEIYRAVIAASIAD
jgi:phosphatidylinositol alpha-mannosyltransferase